LKQFVRILLFAAVAGAGISIFPEWSAWAGWWHRLQPVRAAAAGGADLRFALHGEPKTLDPYLAADESAETLSYLTEGVLIRINRLTRQADPELAESWKVEKGGARIVLRLRAGVKFPDGAAFTSADVVESFHRLLDPALHAPVADSFKTAKGAVQIQAQGPAAVSVEFPAPIAGIERMFDEVAITQALTQAASRAGAAQRPSPGLGPFLIAERKPGVSILLKRNPMYWKRDTDGSPLPKVDAIRLDIEENRDLELLRFRRGEIQIIDKLSPELYEKLASESPGAAVDAGPSLDVEFLWFNQSSNQSKGAALRGPAREWFASAAFRQAVSEAINRADLCRVVYRGHASAASGPVSPSNKLWFNSALKPPAFDPGSAIKRLESAGFHLASGTLRDARGRAVEFSLITNAGSKTRERMAAMIQADLARIGIKVNVVTLDFPSLIERITRTLDYEACLLGLVDIGEDPKEWMNVLLSSASNHPWSPAEKSPETAWEAEIDRLMLAQAASADYRERKKDFDRVQEILREQAPVIYLLHPNALAAVSPRAKGVKVSPFFPHTFWDAEHLRIVGL
jgi:peptide/nickel transport system substrate-binding protein